MAIDQTQAIAKVKERRGLVETVFLSKGGQGATTALSILGMALGKEHRLYAVEMQAQSRPRSAPISHILRLANTRDIPKKVLFKVDHVVMFDETKMTALDSFSAGFLFNIPTGLLIINSPRSPEDFNYPYNFDGEAISVDVTEIAMGMSEIRPAPPGVAMMGVYAGSTGVVGLDALSQAVEEYFSTRGFHAAVASKVVPPNLRGIRLAYDAGKSAKRVPIKGKGQRVEGWAYEELSQIPAHVDLIRRRQLPTYQSGKNPYIWRDDVPVWIDSKCIRCKTCFSWLWCPEHNYRIIKPGQKEEAFDVQIDLSYCKGCYVCSEVCPPHAIEMRPATQVEGAMLSEQSVGLDLSEDWFVQRD